MRLDALKDIRLSLFRVRETPRLPVRPQIDLGAADAHPVYLFVVFSCLSFRHYNRLRIFFVAPVKGNLR